MFRPIIVIAALAGMAASAAPALAATNQLSDTQYIEAARCQGIIDSHKLGNGQAKAIDALMDRESAGRSELAEDMAQDARSTGSRLSQTAGPIEKASLVSERDGVCAAFTGTQASNGAPSGAGS
ncbi:MAG: hypothetical protein ACRED8_06260 [Caulobacteraceae bacterium]